MRCTTAMLPPGGAAGHQSKVPETGPGWLAGRSAGTGSGQQRKKPSWRVDLLELYVGDRRVRRVAKQAHSLIVILNRFEEEDWQTPIANPLPTSPDAERLNDAVMSLNRGLKLIRFGSTGNGRGITWDWNPILKYRDPWTH